MAKRIGKMGFSFVWCMVRVWRSFNWCRSYFLYREAITLETINTGNTRIVLFTFRFYTSQLHTFKSQHSSVFLELVVVSIQLTVGQAWLSGLPAVIRLTVGQPWLRQEYVRLLVLPIMKAGLATSTVVTLLCQQPNLSSDTAFRLNNLFASRWQGHDLVFHCCWFSLRSQRLSDPKGWLS